MTNEKGAGTSGVRAPDRPPAPFKDYLAWLTRNLGRGLEGVEGVTPQKLFAWGEAVGIPEVEMVRKLGEFCRIPFLRTIDLGDVDFHALPRPYCESKLVVPVKSMGASQTLILSNPFDWELLDDLHRTLPRGKRVAILLASRESIRRVFAGEETPQPEPDSRPRAAAASASGVPSLYKGKLYDPSKDPGRNHPIAKLVIDLLHRGVSAGATDLILALKRPGSVAIRAVIGGNSHDLQEVPEDTGKMLVARFKALSGMDVARRRSSQRGRMDVLLHGKVFRLRIVTAPATAFESLAIRVLDLSKRPKTLVELGMNPGQGNTLLELAKEKGGLLLFAGPVGSGKTATVYSLLSALEGTGRTGASVEDPVECGISWMEQKEVQEEGGATVEVLLRAAVGEEPDVLFLSDVDGLLPAATCVDYALVGHLVMASLSTSNSSTAVLRLERMGVARSSLASAVTGLVAQRLIRKLCPVCRDVRPLTLQEASLLKGAAVPLPEETAHPQGCSSCQGTGYSGREAVFEVIRVDSEIAASIRGGKGLDEFRALVRKRGTLLMGDHAVQRVRELRFSVEDVYREVLLEELSPLGESVVALEDADGGQTPGRAGQGAGNGALAMDRPAILVVDDDEDTRVLLDRILAVEGFKVIQASDGGDALLKLGRESIDVILSDIHMPSLDGLKLLEVVHQHRIDAPVILLTAEPSPEVEARCLGMGAVDYLRKPIQKGVLLARIRRALQKSPAGSGRD
jgi:type II secretory ATPase GspE/PulE/Tfp pilus assembly ATPase PilB-like protein/CheY-like chemotaxis protein